MKRLIADLINAAVKDLIDDQPDILDSTHLTTMTEWNFAHHFANSLAKYLFWFNNDIDVVKKDYNKRPDIIFHKRKSCKNNFLVIEIKKGWLINNEDVEKIKEIWFSKVLNYQFGACLSISDAHEYKILVFKNDSTKESEISNVTPLKFQYKKNVENNRLKKEFSRIMSNDIKLDLKRIKLELKRRYTVN